MQRAGLAEERIAEQSTDGTLVLIATADAPLTVPGGDWLLKADFAPQGSDLLLTGADGTQILIHDFFSLEFPPDLITDGGAVIAADLAVRLAGPQAPGQFALLQNGPFQLAQTTTTEIGKVEATDGTVEAIHTDGSREVLSKGSPIFQGDTIETGSGAAIGITFADDTTFSLGEDGRMVIDEMVYDAASQEGVFSASLVQGVFSFVSGEIAKGAPDSMTVTTPVAVIGIRGTKVAGRAAQEGEQNTISLLPETDAQGNTFVGQLSVTNQGGTVVLNAVGATVQLTSSFTPPPPPVIFSPAQIQQNFGATLTTLSTTTAAKATSDAAENAEAAQAADADAQAAEADAAEAEAEAEAAQAEAEAAAAEAEASGDPEAIAAAEAAQAEADAKVAEAETKAAEAEVAQAEAEAKAAEADAAQAEAEHATSEMQTQTQAFAQFGGAPPGDGPGGDHEGPDQVEAAAEEAAKAAIEAGASPEEVFAAAAEAAAAQLAAEGDSPEDIAAETAAAEEAFKAAMAAGATPEEAMALAMQAAENVFGPDNGDFGPGGPEGPGDFGPGGPEGPGDFGPGGPEGPGGFGPGDGGGGFGGDPFFGGGDPFFGGGDPFFGGDDFFGGDGYFGDPLYGDGGDDFFGDPFGGDVYDPLIGDYFNLESTFDYIDGDDHDDPVDYSQPVTSQTSFVAIKKGTSVGDALTGDAGSTNFYFAYADIGGTDTVSGQSGYINQIAFDSMDDMVVKFTIDGSVATTGSVAIWGGNSISGATSANLYTLDNASNYNLDSSPDSTISLFTNVGQYLFADGPVGTLSGGYSSHTEADLTETPTDADSGDVIVMPSLETDDVGYVIAGGAGADTFHIGDSSSAITMDGAIVFGKGGGDTFNINQAMDGLFIGGITSTDNIDDGSNSGVVNDGVPDDGLNVFNYANLDLNPSDGTNSNGVAASIYGFLESSFSATDSNTDPSVYETSAVVTNNTIDTSYSTASNSLNNMLWDVSCFVGTSDADAIALNGARLNTLNTGAGDDIVTVNGTTKFATLDGGIGTDTLQVSFTATTTADSTAAAAAVALGFSLNSDNGHYYRYVPYTGNADSSWDTANGYWSQAEAAAVNVGGGYLATVTSATENAFIYGLTGANQAWLGGNDATTEGTWKWATGPEAGTTFWVGTSGGAAPGGEYSNWFTGQPDDSGSNEDYLHIGGGANTWVDQSSTTGIAGYVVELEVAKQTDMVSSAATGFENVVLTGTSGNDASLDFASSTVSGKVFGVDVTVIDGLGGTDSVELISNFANTMTIQNVENINAAGSGNDEITLNSAMVSGSTVNLNDGTDTLNLFNGTNTVTVSNIETVNGGTGADNITVAAGVSTIIGGDGADTITGGAGADMLAGGTGTDAFIYTTANVAAAGTASVAYDTLSDFIAGTGTSGDIFDWDTALSNNGNAIGASAADLTTSNYLAAWIADTIITGTANTIGVFEFVGASLGANDIIVGTTNSDTIEGWAAAALSTVDHVDGDNMLFVMYDNGATTSTAAVFEFTGDATATDIAETELQLVAVADVTQDMMVSNNFI